MLGTLDSPLEENNILPIVFYKKKLYKVSVIKPEKNKNKVAIDYMSCLQSDSVCEAMLKPHEWRYAWAWEDIRLYLKLESLHIEYYWCDYMYIVNDKYKYEDWSEVDSEDLHYDYNYQEDCYGFRIIKFGNVIYDNKVECSVLTYEEAREEAIKYCLSLINNK